MLLVNKKNKLDSSYVPTDLVEVEDGILGGVSHKLPVVKKEVLEAFRKLQQKGFEEGHGIFINSGYRSYKGQQDLIVEFLGKMTYSDALARVAEPGCSEHQTGLAIDFAILKTIDDTGKHYVRGVDMWDCPHTAWVHENAHKYGFILRFPKGKENFTNQDAEPWHLRYVGVSDATIMKDLNFSLEEYVDRDSGTYIPLIGVVGRVVHDNGGYPVISTGEYYRKSINRNQGAVVTIQPPQDVVYNEITPKNVRRLNEMDKRILDRTLSELDGVVFPGGSKWYEFDEYIASYCLERRIPMFGICLGMQTIAYVDNLNKSVPNLKTYHNDESDIDHKQIGPEYVHPVNLKRGSHLYDLIKQDTIMVNSRHSYNIGGVTNKMVISGFSPDGISEYGEIEDYCIAAQWHPELMSEYDKFNEMMFADFVNKCRK